MTTAAQPKTALFVTDSGAMGGGQRVLLDLLLRIDRKRVRPIVATFEGGALLDRAREAEIETWTLPYGRRLGELPRRSPGLVSLAFAAPGTAALVWWLARRMRRERVNTIVTGTTESHVFGGLAGRRAGARTIARVHDIVSRASFGRIALRAASFALRRADRVLAVSDASRASLLALGVPSERMKTIYNGITSRPAPSPEQRAAVRDRLGVPRDAFVLASVGRLVRWKGQHLLVNAVPSLRQRFPSLRVLIAGEAYFDRGDDYRGELEEHIAANDLGDVVRLLGHRDDVHDIVSASDLLVHTSLEPDPLPTVLLEAIAAGTYVVAADAGGVPEIVSGPGVGLLYPPGDAAALAAAISPARQDPAVARAVLDRFAMQRYVDAMTSELA